MKPHFVHIGFTMDFFEPPQDVIVVVNRFCARFKDIFPYCALKVLYGGGKNYDFIFTWWGEEFFRIVHNEGDELCQFARYGDLQKPLSQWCWASFEKFPFEDRIIPEALCALLERKKCPCSIFYPKVAAMIRPGERICIPAEC